MLMKSVQFQLGLQILIKNTSIDSTPNVHSFNKGTHP